MLKKYKEYLYVGSLCVCVCVCVNVTLGVLIGSGIFLFVWCDYCTNITTASAFFSVHWLFCAPLLSTLPSVYALRRKNGCDAGNVAWYRLWPMELGTPVRATCAPAGPSETWYGGQGLVSVRHPSRSVSRRTRAALRSSIGLVP